MGKTGLEQGLVWTGEEDRAAFSSSPARRAPRTHFHPGRAEWGSGSEQRAAKLRWVLWFHSWCRSSSGKKKKKQTRAHFSAPKHWRSCDEPLKAAGKVGSSSEWG